MLRLYEKNPVGLQDATTEAHYLGVVTQSQVWVGNHGLIYSHNWERRRTTLRTNRKGQPTVSISPLAEWTFLFKARHYNGIPPPLQGE